MVLYERDTKLYRHSTIFSFHHRLVRFFCSAKVSRLRIAHVAQQHGPLTMITAAPCMMHVHQTIVSTFFPIGLIMNISTYYHFITMVQWQCGITVLHLVGILQILSLQKQGFPRRKMPNDFSIQSQKQKHFWDSHENQKQEKPHCS